MCVSALIVLGEKIRSRIDEQTQEHWIISYIGRCRDTDLSFHLKQARNGTNGSLYQPVNLFFSTGERQELMFYTFLPLIGT